MVLGMDYGTSMCGGYKLLKKSCLEWKLSEYVCACFASAASAFAAFF